MPGRAVAASDVGGTFTDLVLWDGKRLRTHKLPTDPSARERVVLDGLGGLLREAAVGAAGLARKVHGTTAATNAILTRRGGKVALVTNEGFEDLIEIGRQNRPSLYDLHAVRPPPLVARELRFGVAGRLDHEGEELDALDEAGVERLTSQLMDVDAVAVAFLHSYANAGHERRAAEILRQAGLARVTTSHEVDPEFREYERFSTTIANAFLLPVFEETLTRLEEGLRDQGATAPLFILESSGGMMGAAEAQRLPVRTVLSGPAGGVAAAGDLARRLRLRRVLSLDMGGTSTDLAVLADGRPGRKQEDAVGGIPIRTPMVDLVTIGAGGGSVAHVGADGILRVGPESAEAWPGPACYGRGGTHATVTDADVVLGRIDADGFLAGAGAIRLEPDKARQACASLGKELGLDPEAAAEALIEVATANLHGGIRTATAARGLDPRGFTLMPFGGAGPVHGIESAPGMGIGRVIVPPVPAVFSAWGMLVAPVHHSFGRNLLVRTEQAEAKEILAVVAELEDEARQRMRSEQVAQRAVRLKRRLDLRYVGQSYEVEVPLARRSRAALDKAFSSFHAAHRRRYGHADPKASVELVAVRVDAEARPAPTPDLPRVVRGPARPSRDATTSHRRAWFLDHGWQDAPVLVRAALRSANTFRGPVIVEGGDHTFLVPPGAKARVGTYGEIEVVL